MSEDDMTLAVRDAIEHLADISRFLERIAIAQERLLEATKLGGALDVHARALNHVADAINRNTAMGGRG